ncbi:MAG: hypothetical protein WC372_10240 [Candidatus Neomarinimicrobiota bacterium]|jgi:hypothetical protein
MQSFTVGVSNTLFVDMVARATGTPITSGTVTFYLQALTGVNAGKWFRTSDDTWQETEEAAGVGSHQADGHWTCTVDSAAWISGVRYFLYAKESGNLHIPYCEEITDRMAAPTNITVETTVIE